MPVTNRKEARPYLDKKELAERVRMYKATGEMPEQLVKDLVNIAGGVWDRYRHTDSRDDFVQDVFAHFMGSPLQKADPTLNVFGWLTTCAIRFGKKQQCKSAERNRKHGEYVADVGYLLGQAVAVDPDEAAGLYDLDPSDPGPMNRKAGPDTTGEYDADA